MIYFDTSALLKLVHQEGETGALTAYLNTRRADPHVSSELVRVELVRALARLNYDDQGRLIDQETYERELGDVTEMLQDVGTVSASTPILISAAALTGPSLRTLDAIHLATAKRLGGGLSAFVTYDRRLAAAASDAGLPVATPS